MSADDTAPSVMTRLTRVPNKPKTPTSTFRLDPALMAQVKAKAAARGETVTDVVRRALVNYVRRK